MPTRRLPGDFQRRWPWPLWSSWPPVAFGGASIDRLRSRQWLHPHPKPRTRQCPAKRCLLLRSSRADGSGPKAVTSSRSGAWKPAGKWMRPILIHARSTWPKRRRSKDGEDLKVFVELRDVNYPGSTYTLTYQPATDRLAGTYFHALSGQNMDVEFSRLGEP